LTVVIPDHDVESPAGSSAQQPDHGGEVGLEVTGSAHGA
jgi:hypothetical protein